MSLTLNRTNSLNAPPQTTHTPKTMLPVTLNHRRVAFRDVAIGEEFLWGSYYWEKANWGKKRSSRTADYRPRLDGKLTDWTDWGYWKGDEAVYVKR